MQLHAARRCGENLCTTCYRGPVTKQRHRQSQKMLSYRFPQNSLRRKCLVTNEQIRESERTAVTPLSCERVGAQRCEEISKAAIVCALNGKAPTIRNGRHHAAFVRNCQSTRRRLALRRKCKTCCRDSVTKEQHRQSKRKAYRTTSFELVGATRRDPPTIPSKSCHTDLVRTFRSNRHRLALWRKLRRAIEPNSLELDGATSRCPAMR